MNKCFFSVLISLVTVATVAGSVLAAPDDESFDESARRALDEYEQQMAQAVREVSTPDQNTSHQQVQRFNESRQQAGRDREGYSVQPAPLRKRHTFEGGVEVYQYNYREIVQGLFFAGTHGNYQGLFANYTYHPNQNDNPTNYYPTMYRLEGRTATGSVDYRGSGTWDGLKDSMFEVRGVLGYDYMPVPSVRITPYAGLGWRYLNNGLEAIPAMTIDGKDYASGYNRESRYFYFPLGGELEKTFDQGWRLGMSLEYDFLWKGEQVSHFEDMKDKNGQSLGFDPMTNAQNKGRGFRGSVKLAKEFSRCAIYIEPFIRFWDIEEAKPGFMTMGGQLVPDPNNPGYYLGGTEPQNTTKEIGMKLGVKF